MFERYTERSRRVIFFARYEASVFGSTTIETEHLLLGLLREAKNVVSRFAHVTGSGATIREEVSARLPVREKLPTSIDLPLSAECKRVLAYALEEAERLQHPHIGTEHLLLGFLREERCVAAEILRQHGADLQTIREQLAASPLPDEPISERHGIIAEFLSPKHNPVLPKGGVVGDGETAKRIAEALWLPMYGAEVIAEQQPLSVELRFNVWMVTGAADLDTLFAFILREDGRVLSIGKGTNKTQ